jgi:hypothetical protein
MLASLATKLEMEAVEVLGDETDETEEPPQPDTLTKCRVRLAIHTARRRRRFIRFFL